jgi:GNAT superfamily N-acetyltransferase
VQPLEVAPVRGRRDLEAFIALPYELYRGDPRWVPPLRRDVRDLLSRTKNPFFEHAEAEYFLARREDRVVGRIAAIHNRLHNEFHADRTGFFGFFETVNDPAVAAALLDAAEAWLAPRGLDVMRGPASFSTNDEAGLLVDGFDTPPVVMMPHNPPHYATLIEGAGFRKAKDLLAYQRTDTGLPARLVQGAALAERRYGVRVRPLELGRFDQEVVVIKQLYNASWERNWGFVPMTDHEIDHLAKQLKPVVVPELVLFAERGDETIGFAVALPDLNVALRANPSGRMFPGILKVLWAARKIRRIRILLLGALPAWRGKGIDVLLFKHVWEKATGKGYNWGEGGWILEDNQAMRNGLERMGFEAYKTYRLYDRPMKASTTISAGGQS